MAIRAPDGANKSQGSRILGFFILYFHQSMKSRHPRVVASPAMSSIVPCTLFLKMEQAKVFFFLTPFYSVSNSHRSGTADRQLQVARGSQQVVQNDTEGGETEDTHSFLILLFRKVNVKS